MWDLLDSKEFQVRGVSLTAEKDCGKPRAVSADSCVLRVSEDGCVFFFFSPDCSLATLIKSFVLPMYILPFMHVVKQQHIYSLQSRVVNASVSCFLQPVTHSGLFSFPGTCKSILKMQRNYVRPQVNAESSEFLFLFSCKPLWSIQYIVYISFQILSCS